MFWCFFFEGHFLLLCNSLASLKSNNFSYKKNKLKILLPSEQKEIDLEMEKNSRKGKIKETSTSSNLFSHVLEINKKKKSTLKYV